MCCCLNSIYKKPLGKVKLWRQKVPQWLPGAGVGVKSSCQREGENFLRGWMCPQTGSRWSYCTDASKPGSSMLTWYLKCTAIKKAFPSQERQCSPWPPGPHDLAPCLPLCSHSSSVTRLAQPHWPPHAPVSHQASPILGPSNWLFP